ncbi:MAG: helix-turn-helix domain-containing protein [Thermomicrobiales bacterium]
MVQATSRPVGDQIEQIQQRLGVSDEEIASALGVAPRTVASWRRQDAMPERAARQRLEALAALDRHLHDTLKAETVAPWLRTRPHNLGGMTPAEVIANGEFDRIEGLLTVVDHGMFG